MLPHDCSVIEQVIIDISQFGHLRHFAFDIFPKANGQMTQWLNGST